MTAVVMPAMQATQEASWLGLFRLAESIPDGWTLVGGQMVGGGRLPGSGCDHG